MSTLPPQPPLPPPPPRTGRTILKYLKLDFQGAWEYSGREYSFRPSGPPGSTADLYVLTESPTGTLVSYRFIVHRRPDLPDGAFLPTDTVIAPNTENIVYVPERCATRYVGDPTACFE